jgi:hypothetical protein
MTVRKELIVVHRHEDVGRNRMVGVGDGWGGLYYVYMVRPGWGPVPVPVKYSD